MGLPNVNLPLVDCPPDKSITHRLLFFAAMAPGRSVVRNPLICADTRSTIDCLKQFGVNFLFGEPLSDPLSDPLSEPYGTESDSFCLTVESPGFAQWHEPQLPLNAGNSGTTSRFLLALISACPGVRAEICGDDSLSKRPMRRVLDLLAEAGALPVASNNLPLTLTGTRLRPFNVTSTVASAQVKTAMILAALTCEGESFVTLPAGSRDHTEILCARLGLNLVVERLPIAVQIPHLEAPGNAANRERITISGPAAVPPFDLTVPGDPSSAAFLVAAGLLSGSGAQIRQICANQLRSSFLDVLDQAGVNLIRQPLPVPGFVEPVESWLVPAGMGSRWGLRGVGEIPPAWAPSLIDEVPILATILAFGAGESIFRGVGELRVKESDRLAGTVRLLRAAGCEAIVVGNDLIVPGGLTRGAIKDFEFDSEGDHRLTMCAMVLERIAKKTCKISERSCVDVSFPDFPAVLTCWD